MKNREMLRINKENAILMRFQYRIEDRGIKRQIQKACRRILKAFRGVVDDEELNCEREVQASEIHLNQIHCE